MKIIITGSLGNIGKPLTNSLVDQGHRVTVVSSDLKKRETIESLGAIPAIGSIADVSFLTDICKGADALFAMIPLSTREEDISVYLRQMAQNYRQAIIKSGIRRVVLLSGWAADLIAGENIEDIFDGLHCSLTIMRPAIFYSNFFQYIPLIKGTGLMGKILTMQHAGMGALLKGRTGLIMGNYGAEDRVVFVSPRDIADAVAQQLVLYPEQKTIYYVGSDEMTCNEAAGILGRAIGKPWLKWVLLSDKKMKQGLRLSKVPEKLAETLIQMQAAIHSGKALTHFHQRDNVLGRVKLADFAKEFAEVYHRNP